MSTELVATAKGMLMTQRRLPPALEPLGKTELPAYVAHFTDGSVSPVERITWSPEFLTGIATRGDGKKRAVFFGQRNGAMLQEDPWILRLEPAKPSLNLVA